MTKYVGHWAGNLIVREGDDISELLSVGDYLYVEAAFTAPALTSVGDYLYVRAAFTAPALTSVGDYLYVEAKFTAPKLVSVGPKRDCPLHHTWFGPVGREGRYAPIFRATNSGLIVRLGCFRGTVDEALASIAEKYGTDSDYAAEVRGAVERAAA